MTLKTTPADVPVLPRDIRFDVEPAGAGHWLGGDPVGTAVFNALSLTFPDGERLFMDAVRNYRGQLYYTGNGQIFRSEGYGDYQIFYRFTESKTAKNGDKTYETQYVREIFIERHQASFNRWNFLTMCLL